MSVTVEQPTSVRVTTDQPEVRAVVVSQARSVPEAVTYGVVAAVAVTVAQGGARVVHVGGSGPPGPQGPSGGGGAGGSVYEFVQAEPSASWTIPHGLGRAPVVAVYDTSGQLRPFVEAQELDLNTLVLTPSPPLAGKAVLL